jgi:hypothetical protein
MTGKLKNKYSLPKSNGMPDRNINQYMDVLVSHYFRKFNCCVYWLMNEALNSRHPINEVYQT